MERSVETIIKPRFSETDMRGHIGNTVIPVWLSEGRGVLFREILGSKLPLVVANLNVDYRGELFLGSPVTVRTAIKKIGNSSICYQQEIWQYDVCCVTAHTTVIAIDSGTGKPMRVPDRERNLLKDYVVSGC